MATMHPLEQFYLDQPEPNRSCFLALRDFIAGFHPSITQEWKWKLPFFYFKGKMLCYLWYDKQSKPYVGVADGYLIEHPALVTGERKRIKILPIDPDCDLPVKTLNEVLNSAIAIHQPTETTR